MPVPARLTGPTTFRTIPFRASRTRGTTVVRKAGTTPITPFDTGSELRQTKQSALRAVKAGRCTLTTEEW
jgi:hypothetical protein